jgi:hypothetical protein
MKRSFGSSGADDNERVLRYLAKLTLNPAVAHGLAHEVGSVEVGKLADIVLWDPAWFGAKPTLLPRHHLRHPIGRFRSRSPTHHRASALAPHRNRTIPHECGSSAVSARVAGRVVPVMHLIAFRRLEGSPASHDDGASWWL